MSGTAKHEVSLDEERNKTSPRFLPFSSPVLSPVASPLHFLTSTVQAELGLIPISSGRRLRSVPACPLPPATPPRLRTPQLAAPVSAPASPSLPPSLAPLPSLAMVPPTQIPCELCSFKSLLPQAPHGRPAFWVGGKEGEPPHGPAAPPGAGAQHPLLQRCLRSSSPISTRPTKEDGPGASRIHPEDWRLCTGPCGRTSQGDNMAGGCATTGAWPYPGPLSSQKLGPSPHRSPQGPHQRGVGTSCLVSRT